MRTFFFVVLDLILLAICVAYGEFIGFGLWLVLTCVGVWVDRSHRIRLAELDLRARELEARRPSRDD